MSCLTTTRKNEILAEITELEETLVVLKAAYLRSASGSDAEGYRLDTGEASQKVDLRSPKEVREEMNYIKDEIQFLKRKLLPGGGNVNLNLRR